jgi:hypothetical protein
MLHLKENYEFKVVTVFVILFFLTPAYVFSFDDEFGHSRKTKSKHFNIYYVAQVDISYLIQKLNISLSDRVFFGKSVNRKVSLEKEFAAMLDTLFIQVCDILDMPLYSFRTNIKICRDDE